VTSVYIYIHKRRFYSAWTFSWSVAWMQIYDSWQYFYSACFYIP